jgi:hypothetical protein
MNQEETTPDESLPNRTLTEVQRRLVGVLIEKAKTTPEQYPLSLNALVTGSNQKSNRDPLMSLEADDVQVVLDELRGIGAVIEVQSGGRVPKFKHLMYEWLGVDKVEIAVMAELLVRGAQTIGELRGRASRMESIADVNSLQPVIQSLREKDLLVDLTPAGRGQIVTHALYEDYELEALRKEYRDRPAESGPEGRARSTPAPAAPPIRGELDQLRQQVADLADRVDQLTSRLDRLES